MQETRPRVLLIEDEASLAHWIVRYLERCGYAVDTCATGREALSRLDSEAYAAVVADWTVPDLSGEELAEGIARLRPLLPLLVTSGYPAASLPLPAHARFLQKPFRPEQLAALLGELLPVPVAV